MEYPLSLCVGPESQDKCGISRKINQIVIVTERTQKILLPVVHSAETKDLDSHEALEKGVTKDGNSRGFHDKECSGVLAIQHLSNVRE